MAERFRAIAAVAGIVLGAGAARADIWDELDGGTHPTGDFNCATSIVELVHGARQVHDLNIQQLFPDRDWARVQQRAYRSYEVRYPGSTMQLTWAARRGCDGGLLTPAQQSGVFGGTSIRWLSTGDEPTHILTDAGWQTSVTYNIQLLETTYAVPRYNNSATQQTILVIQNARTATVRGVVSFFSSAGGAAIHIHPFTIPPHGVLVLNTSTLPALVGTSGSALIAHDGAYGALAGKAVALEPVTGFTFDTPIVAKPY